MYLNSIQDGADLLSNYINFKDFKENKLSPLEQEIREVEAKLRIIRKEEEEEQNLIRDIEIEEQFEKSRKNLVDQLYQDLDQVHKQIPEEAQAVGMSTKMAIETYLPELVTRTKLLEHLIAMAEKAKYSSDLEDVDKHRRSGLWYS